MINKEYRPYQHVERLGTVETEGIENGTCYIFPKIDGTNGVVWFDGTIRVGSRNREIIDPIGNPNKDNQGFGSYVLLILKPRLDKFFEKYPNYRLYGEWLIPNILKTYKDDAWRKFYIFDVVEDIDSEINKYKYIPYDIYKPILDEFGLDYISPIVVIKDMPCDNKTFYDALEQNTFLIKDNAGVGEGIVIKNYDWKGNRFGRISWAKIVSNEFKENKFNKNTSNKNIHIIEEKIVDNYISSAFIEKTYTKIVNAENGWSQKFIPRLLETVWYDFIKEDFYDVVIKKENVSNINLKLLKNLIIKKIKEVKRELFT